MENYTYNSYPESGGSSPRSREIDFENPPPWEDHSTGNNINNSNNSNYKVKLMCSYGGKIHPRPHDNQLAYVGGETKILAVDRSTKFTALAAKLAALCDADVSFKYQLPGEDLDALISVTNDDDLDHMMIEYDRLNRASPKPARLRLFLFPVSTRTPSISSAHSFGSIEGKSERDRFVDALNSGPVQSSTPPPALPTHGNADFLFGSEKGVAPAPAVVPKLPIADPPIRHPEPDVAPILDERGIGAGADRIQKHIQDLRRLRISEEQQQQQQQQQSFYRRQNDDSLNSGYTGDYYVQRATEKVIPTTLPGSAPAPATGYQISGGFTASTISPDQQPVYMMPPPLNMYHNPIARPVTGPIGHNPGQGQGYYAVQRMPNEVYREQPVYNAMQPVQPVSTQAMFPPQQQQPLQQKEGVRMADHAGYGQVAYDNGVGRHVYYPAQGNLVTQANTQQYHQAMGATSATLNQDGKIVAPTKISQGSI